MQAIKKFLALPHEQEKVSILAAEYKKLTPQDKIDLIALFKEIGVEIKETQGVAAAA